MRCGPGQIQGQENRYGDEICDNGTTQYTNADVTSLMGADEMMRQGPTINETSMVQDQDLQKLIG